MPVTNIDPAKMIIGPAFIRYRAVGVLTPFTDLGVTLDDVVMRIGTEWVDTGNLSGIMTKPKGLDVLTSLSAGAEFTLPDFAGSKMALAIPGSQFQAEVHADTGATPFSSTLSAASVVGTSTISVVATTNLTVGDFIRIEAAANANEELRQVTAINALVLTLDAPLLIAHPAATVAVETTGDGRDIVTAPVIRRQPASAYNEWSIIAESGKNHYTELRFPIAISQTTSAEVSIADDSIAGIRVSLEARSDPTNLATSPYKLYSVTFPA